MEEPNYITVGQLKKELEKYIAEKDPDEFLFKSNI